MSEELWNPRAFPLAINDLGDAGYEGMTLRDYFAAAASTGAAANELFRREATHHPKVIAEFSYGVADAMLAARRKP